MKVCQNCDQSLEEDERFCGSCGNKAEEAPAQQAGGFCHNCGEGMEGEMVFCPNCGANTQTGAPPAAQEAVAPPKGLPKLPVNNRTVGIAAVVLVAVVAVVLIISLGKLFGSPADRFVSHQKEFLTADLMGRLETLAKQYNEYATLSTDLTLTAQVDGDEINEYLEDSALGVKVMLDKKSVLLNGELTVMGSPILSGGLSYKDGTVGAFLPDVDPAYYTADLSKLAQTFGGMNAADFSQLEIPEIPTSTLTKLGKLYVDVVLGAVNKDNVTLEDSDSIRLEHLGKKVEGKLYVFEPTAEDLEEMLLKLADTIERDKELRGFVTGVLGGNRAVLDEILDLDIEEELDGALLDAADYLRDNADSVARNLQRMGFQWTLGVSDKRVCLQKIGTKNGGQYITYESWGKDSEGRRIGVYAESGGGVQNGVTLNWTKKGDIYNGSAALLEYGDTLFSVKFRDVNKERESALGIPYGTYELDVEWYGGYDNIEVTLEVEGSKSGGSDHVLRIEGLDDYTLGNWLEVKLNTSDKKSTASTPKGKTTDITDYSDEELYQLVYEIGNSLSQTFYELGIR